MQPGSSHPSDSDARDRVAPVALSGIEIADAVHARVYVYVTLLASARRGATTGTTALDEGRARNVGAQLIIALGP